MKKGGGKQKGSQFEREISVKLSLWLSSGEREDLLWRSSMSGGRATVAKKRGKELKTQAGDLCAVHPDAQPFIDKFYAELKFYQNLDYASIIGGKGTLLKFWESTITEANCYKRHPMLIAKQNRQPCVIYLNRAGFQVLGLVEAQTVLIAYPYNMYGFLLDQFVRWARLP